MWLRNLLKCWKIQKRKYINTKNFEKKMIYENADKLNFKAAKSCHLCYGPFEKNDKVKDHCHFTGKYRGAAHAKGNLNYYRKPRL